ncbi:phosphatidylethanolamine-binding protein [Chaetomium sp. MPI-SDFR-AT-0129]|nr:phosphatidylethanolamine-binding protein [Chaetomium sp. MPI-SDFR-AT-0129]
MRSLSFPFSFALLVAGIALAQTPAGFVPEVADKLEIVFGTKTVETPGASLEKTDTANQPTIGTSDAPLTDIDVPTNFQNPSAGGRQTNLHALLTGFTPSTTNPEEGGIYTLTPPSSSSDGSAVVPYVGPAPPAENPPYPHRYVSLLYETEDGFMVQREQVGQTLGFDLAVFVEKVGLGTPVRAGYFNVTG